MAIERAAGLGWGVVGCGDVVEHKSGPAIGHAPRSDMVLVMRRDGAAARDFARRHGVARWTGAAQQVIDDDAVDIVYVATPPSSHLEHVLAAAAAGKHVLVEKPMAMNAAEGREMVVACAAAGVELFVAYYRRFWPHILRLRALLAEGVIGRPLLGVVDVSWDDVAGRRRAGTRAWRDDPAVGGGGGFVDICSHRIDLLVWLLGPVAAAHGVATRFDRDLEVEQIAAAVMRMESGALCSVIGDFHSARDVDRFFIGGEARPRYGRPARRPCAYAGDGERDRGVALQPVGGTAPRPGAPHRGGPARRRGQPDPGDPRGGYRDGARYRALRGGPGAVALSTECRAVPGDALVRKERC